MSIHQESSVFLFIMRNWVKLQLRQFSERRDLSPRSRFLAGLALVRQMKSHVDSQIKVAT